MMNVGAGVDLGGGRERDLGFAWGTMLLEDELASEVSIRSMMLVFFTALFFCVLGGLDVG